jgi:GT2 family glycosyltransferase
MQDEESVSFVVIAYNEEDHVAQTLDAITRLDGLGEHEIIVVDDCSRDSTARIVTDISKHNPHVRPVNLPDNRGRGYARSRGVAAAQGGLIAMVDADIILPFDWLARAREALQSHDAVGGTAVPDGDVAFIYRKFDLIPRIVSGTATVTGNNGLYRRRVFDVVSFDPLLREGEDTALNYAMKREGLSSHTIPGLLVRHEESKDLVTSFRWLFESGRGATRQFVAYHDLRQPDIVTFGFFGAAALGLSLALDHPLIGAAIPTALILVAGTQHVRTRFMIAQSPLRSVASGVLVDSAMLAAYFAGRMVGLTVLFRRLDFARFPVSDVMSGPIRRRFRWNIGLRRDGRTASRYR